jgi:hypothetical protein
MVVKNEDLKMETTKTFNLERYVKLKIFKEKQSTNQLIITNEGSNNIFIHNEKLGNFKIIGILLKPQEIIIFNNKDRSFRLFAYCLKENTVKVKFTTPLPKPKHEHMGLIRTTARENQHYGTLTITKILPSEKTILKSGRTSYKVMVECKCICGKIVTRSKKALVEGNQQHCGEIGCMRRRKEVEKFRSWSGN